MEAIGLGLNRSLAESWRFEPPWLNYWVVEAALKGFSRLFSHVVFCDQSVWCSPPSFLLLPGNLDTTTLVLVDTTLSTISSSPSCFNGSAALALIILSNSSHSHYSTPLSSHQLQVQLYQAPHSYSMRYPCGSNPFMHNPATSLFLGNHHFLVNLGLGFLS